MAVGIVDLLEVVNVHHREVSFAALSLGSLECLQHIVAVIKPRELIPDRCILKLLLVVSDEREHEARVEHEESNYRNGIHYPEYARDGIVHSVDGTDIRGVGGGQEVADGNDAAHHESIHPGPSQLLRHVLRIEYDGDHGQAVEVEGHLVAEADRADAHIEREPEVDQPDVYVKTLLGHKDITYDIHERRRYRKPHQEVRLRKQEEPGKPEHQGKYHRVDDEREPLYPLKIQLCPASRKFIPII